MFIFFFLSVHSKKLSTWCTLETSILMLITSVVGIKFQIPFSYGQHHCPYSNCVMLDVKLNWTFSTFYFQKKEWPCCNCGLPYSNFSLVIFCLCFFLFYIATQILHGKPFSTQYFFLTDSDYGSSHYWEVLFENSCF